MNRENDNSEKEKEKKDKSELRNNHEYNKEKGSDGNILDELFFKTKTKPYIYYLPLTKEQVRQKLEKKKML